jgi:hypothetical protein
MTFHKALRPICRSSASDALSAEHTPADHLDPSQIAMLVTQLLAHTAPV